MKSSCVGGVINQRTVAVEAASAAVVAMIVAVVVVDTPTRVETACMRTGAHRWLTNTRSFVLVGMSGGGNKTERRSDHLRSLEVVMRAM